MTIVLGVQVPDDGEAYSSAALPNGRAAGATADVSTADGPTATAGGAGGHGDGSVTDPTDLLVPPPRSELRMLAAGALAVVVLLALTFVPLSGLFPDRLSSGDGGTMSVARHGPVSISGQVIDDGWLPMTITGVDAPEPGLSGVTVSLARTSDGQTVRPPLRLGAGDGVWVTLTYTSIDCSRIDRRGEGVITVETRTALGIPWAVRVVPWQVQVATGGGLQPEPAGGTYPGGWPAAATSAACHRGPPIGGFAP
jgi:hypothetical protein